jgi:SAM-dependent methyltransferase
VFEAAGVGGGDDEGRTDIHGFHAYPGRMHPRVAAAIVEAWSRIGDRVLDPFCGSGTVPCEALALERRAIGVDLNPLAIRLAAFKARAWTEARAAAVPPAARGLAERARAARHGAPRGEDRFFEPHVLRELANLRGELRREPPGEPREALELVLSSILVKVSKQLSDTRTEPTRKQLARGFTTTLFVRKAEELERRLGAFARRLPQGAAAAEIRAGDARRLPGVAASSVALVATSPPYAGAFDYLAHHERRARWLGLDLGALQGGEIGARRGDPNSFGHDLRDCLRAMARALRPGGLAVLVTGDDLVPRLAPEAGLRFVAAATQPRPRGRREHLILLRKPE